MEEESNIIWAWKISSDLASEIKGTVVPNDESDRTFTPVQDFNGNWCIFDKEYTGLEESQYEKIEWVPPVINED